MLELTEAGNSGMAEVMSRAASYAFHRARTRAKTLAQHAGFRRSGRSVASRLRGESDARFADIDINASGARETR